MRQATESERSYDLLSIKRSSGLMSPRFPCPSSWRSALRNNSRLRSTTSFGRGRPLFQRSHANKRIPCGPHPLLQRPRRQGMRSFRRDAGQVLIISHIRNYIRLFIALAIVVISSLSGLSTPEDIRVSIVGRLLSKHLASLFRTHVSEFGGTVEQTDRWTVL